MTSTLYRVRADQTTAAPVRTLPVLNLCTMMDIGHIATREPMKSMEEVQLYYWPTMFRSVLMPKIAAVLRDTLSTAPHVAVQNKHGNKIQSVLLIALFCS